jgi:serine/threonine-protein kinase
MSKESIGELFGRYRTVSRLGRGGMGEVFLAEDSELERKVALKVLLPEVAGDEERVRRFVQEAKAASALNHPNILTVHEIGTVDHTRYIVTEYIKGETLRERLSKEPISLRETLEVTLQVAAALAAAHGARIVHRDIKPENIMIRDDGFAKVLDFGLAKLSDASHKTSDSEDATRAQVHTAPGAVMGTADYMSPEQARGKETDARTDIWSLGVVLYEMLSGGRSPFKGETANDTIAAILTKEPPPLDESVPHELRRITKRALRKKTDDRYQTVQDFLLDLRDLKRELEFTEELERSHIPSYSRSASVGITATGENPTATHSAAISTRDSSAHHPSSAEYVVTEVKKHKFASLAAVLLLVLGTAGSGYWFLNRSATPGIGSIAVLPFANVGGDPEFEFVSDGLSEALINNLSRLPNVKVIARSSAFTFKGKEIDPIEAARQLGVEAIVTGRVQQRGDSVTIAVEMVNAADRTQMWGDTFDRKTSEMRSIPTEIARMVSEKLRNKLTGEQEKLLAKGETTNAQAYELYLKGRHFAGKGGRTNILKGIEYAEQAIAIDPLYANAYAVLSVSYGNMAAYGNSSERKAYLQRQNSAVLKAMELAPESDQALNALGSLKLSELKWTEAESAYKRAGEINPNFVAAHSNLASIFLILKRIDEAIALGKRAIELDPLRASLRANQMGRLLAAGRFDDVIQEAPQVLALSPENTAVYLNRGLAYERKKMFPEAVADLQKACEIDKESVDYRIQLASVYASSGDRSRAETILKENEPQMDKISPAVLAGLYSALGDNQKAMDLLEKAFVEAPAGLRGVAADHSFDPIRFEPRFKELMRKMNVPE